MTNNTTTEPLGVLKWIGTGILYVVGGLFSILMDIFGFYLTVGLNAAVIVGAYLIDPTLGSVTAFLVIGGWILYGVVTIFLEFGGDKLVEKALNSGD